MEALHCEVSISVEIAGPEARQVNEAVYLLQNLRRSLNNSNNPETLSGFQLLDQHLRIGLTNSIRPLDT